MFRKTNLWHHRSPLTYTGQLFFWVVFFGFPVVFPWVVCYFLLWQFFLFLVILWFYKNSFLFLELLSLLKFLTVCFCFWSNNGPFGECYFRLRMLNSNKKLLPSKVLHIFFLVSLFFFSFVIEPGILTKLYQPKRQILEIKMYFFQL